LPRREIAAQLLLAQTHSHAGEVSRTQQLVSPGDTFMRLNSIVDLSVRRALRVAVLAAGTSASIAFFPGAAFAAGAEVEGIEEVVVTARFREENLQSTPLAISAFSEEDLTARSVVNVSDLGATIPNAFIRQQNSNFGPTQTIGMRGIIQTDFTYAFEPAVGIYIDDIYHGTLTGSTMDLLDLDRVEVLRGPQGTLFGINTMGGAVRLISRSRGAMDRATSMLPTARAAAST
jgi:iron complex outermembrane recepter protein